MNSKFSISIELPKDIFITLNENEAQLEKDIRATYAIWLYQKEKLTLGKAAQLAGVSRLDFELLLAQYSIPISKLGIDDVKKDISKLN